MPYLRETKWELGYAISLGSAMCGMQVSNDDFGVDVDEYCDINGGKDEKDGELKDVAYGDGDVESGSFFLTIAVAYDVLAAAASDDDEQPLLSRTYLKGGHFPLDYQDFAFYVS